MNNDRPDPRTAEEPERRGVMSAQDRYDELVDLLEEVGVMQLEDEWAEQIQDLVTVHRLNSIEEEEYSK
jgi:hypothetical protein